MLNDRQGLPIGTDSKQVVDIVDAFAGEFLGWGRNASAIADALAIDPGCVIANCHAAVLQLLVDRLRGDRRAEPYLSRARAEVGRASEHERAFLAAVEAWSREDIPEAIERMEAIVEAHPRDLVTLRLAQLFHFNRGNSYGLLRLVEKVFPENQDSPYIHGLLAFGYEQSNRLPEAEEAGRRGVERKRDEIWAQHAVTHVLDSQGRLEEGIAWLQDLAPTWGTRNTDINAHLWWHLALHLLDADAPAAALALFDDQVWNEANWDAKRDASRYPIHGIHLLLRLRLHGVDVDSRFQRAAERVANRINDPVEVYPTLLYLYALARGGKKSEMTALLESIDLRAACAKPYDKQAWREVAVPVARGLVAHALDDFETAWRVLAPVSHNWIPIGVSHSQRDVFGQLWLDTLIKTGRRDQALRVLREREAARADIPLLHRAYARLYEDAGAPALAEQSRQRATALTRRYRNFH